MKNGIHFIAGLPRSGSTLLAAILRQNPRFHAGMTSPVGAMYMALEGAMSRRSEAAVFIDEEQRRAVLKGLFSNYYNAIHTHKLVFDTNRAWCTKLPAITQLFPESKFICCVRDISWIMDSIESLVRKNAFELSGMFGFEPGNTVRILTAEGREIARGIANYNAAEARRIMGAHTNEIAAILGDKPYDEVIHRDNLVLLV